MSPIQGVTQTFPGIPHKVPGIATTTVPESSDFIDSLKSAISKANDIQLEGTQAVDALMTGQTQDVHRTMVALQQADVSFQLMMQIRNKVVTAYEQIQQMQV